MSALSQMQRSELRSIPGLSVSTIDTVIAILEELSGEGPITIGGAGVSFSASIVGAAFAANRTYTLPDAGAAADFVMTAGNQSIAGNKTFTGTSVFTTATSTGGGVTLADDNGWTIAGVATIANFERSTTDKIGFFAATPVVQQSAITQTYATASATHAAPTAATLTVTDGAGTNDNTIGAITADASVIAAVQEIADEINKLVADVANVKQVLNTVVDYLQAYGFIAAS